METVRYSVGDSDASCEQELEYNATLVRRYP